MRNAEVVNTSDISPGTPDTIRRPSHEAASAASDPGRSGWHPCISGSVLDNEGIERLAQSTDRHELAPAAERAIRGLQVGSGQNAAPEPELRGLPHA
jgi:hypothetical protein